MYQKFQVGVFAPNDAKGDQYQSLFGDSILEDFHVKTSSGIRGLWIHDLSETIQPEGEPGQMYWSNKTSLQVPSAKKIYPWFAYTAGRRKEKQLRHWLYLEFAQGNSVLFVEYEKNIVKIIGKENFL